MIRTYPHDSLKVQPQSGNFINSGKPCRWAHFWIIAERSILRRLGHTKYYSTSHKRGWGGLGKELSFSFIEKMKAIRCSSCHFQIKSMDQSTVHVASPPSCQNRGCNFSSSSRKILLFVLWFLSHATFWFSQLLPLSPFFAKSNGHFSMIIFQPLGNM